MGNDLTKLGVMMSAVSPFGRVMVGTGIAISVKVVIRFFPFNVEACLNACPKFLT